MNLAKHVICQVRLFSKYEKRQYYIDNKYKGDEIKDVVKKIFDKTVEFIDVPDAEQYRIRKK